MIALKRASKGVTLVELIMVTAILSVLASVVYPVFADLRQAGAARSARSELTVAISQARSTAIMQRQNVIACPTSDHMRCSQDLHWQHGWLVFVDETRNREHDDGETLVASGQALPAGIAVLSTSGHYQKR